MQINFIIKNLYQKYFDDFTVLQNCYIRIQHNNAFGRRPTAHFVIELKALTD